MSKTDLDYLIKHMHPTLMDGCLVFICLADNQIAPHLEACIALVKESEGITLVLPEPYAKQHYLDYDGTYRQISLAVASDLQAVGLTATFATALAEKNIPANVLAGFYHDHILVPEALSIQALNTLNDLARKS